MKEKVEKCPLCLEGHLERQMDAFRECSNCHAWFDPGELTLIRKLEQLTKAIKSVDKALNLLGRTIESKEL